MDTIIYSGVWDFEYIPFPIKHIHLTWFYLLKEYSVNKVVTQSI